jgi:hypothetical protein
VELPALQFHNRKYSAAYESTKVPTPLSHLLDILKCMFCPTPGRLERAGMPCSRSLASPPMPDNIRSFGALNYTARSATCSKMAGSIPFVTAYTYRATCDYHTLSSDKGEIKTVAVNHHAGCRLSLEKNISSNGPLIELRGLASRGFFEEKKSPMSFLQYFVKSM